MKFSILKLILNFKKGRRQTDVEIFSLYMISYKDFARFSGLGGIIAMCLEELFFLNVKCLVVQILLIFM